MFLFSTSNCGGHNHLIGLLKKIDNWLSKKGGKSTARRREYGDMCERPTPKDVPNWMILTTCPEGNMDIGSLSDELISSGDELPENVI